jgi:Ca2+-transporting ATPase
MEVWRSWVRWTTAGETVGFAVPALAAAGAAALPGEGWRWLLLLAAGATEGAVLGWAQTRVLRRVLPGLPTRAWVLRTAMAAVVAWAVGLTPAAVWPSLADLPVGGAVALGALGGALLLASIGVAQWTVLRGRLAGSEQWIGWTALGWCVGLAVFTLVTTPLWQPGQTGGLIAAIGVLGGVLMAATVAAVTGWGLVRMLARDRAQRAGVASG